MPKRQLRSRDAAAVPSKQSRHQALRTTCIVCGLDSEAKIAIARCLLKEMHSATVLVSELKVGRRAIPKTGGAFEVREYTTATPKALPQGHPQNIMVLSHDLARPSRVAAAMACSSHAVRLLTVVDARSFFDEWESPAKLPQALRKAGENDQRAHLHDKSTSEVLAEHVESANVIALSHTEAVDTNDLDMLEAMLRELNPTAMVVRRTGDGAGGGKLLETVVRARGNTLSPDKRSGCLQALLEARRQSAIEDSEAQGEGDAEEKEGEADDDKNDDCDGCDDDSSDDSSDDSDDDDDDDDSDGDGAGDQEDDEVAEEEDDDGDGDGEEGQESWVAPVMHSFTFLARRPFHPGRLHKLLKRGRPDGVIRSQGLIWVASHPEDMISWNQVGNILRLLPGEPWLHASLPIPEWPTDAPRWARTATHGDRRIELALIGMDADPTAVRRALNRALVTRAEFALGAEVWQEWEDKVSPLPAKQSVGLPKKVASIIRAAVRGQIHRDIRPQAIGRRSSRLAAKRGNTGPMQVTVLSGFLGAGKTSLLQHLLHNRTGHRIAVVVNDMASVNIDAQLVRRSSVLQLEEKMVELSNGCICCTLREDLLTALADLAAERRFDHVIVESSGISEPLPVAETFTFRDKKSGLSLSDVASLHNLVTVVDAASLFEQLSTVDTLVDRGWHAGEGDRRTVAQLLCDQLEFANVLVVNKLDLVSEVQLLTVEALLRKINPTAEIVRTLHSEVEPALLLGGSARFKLAEAEDHPHWLAEAREHEHTPETVEYSISSFIYRAKRPFHPQRLHATLGTRQCQGALSGLLRVKGAAWLATRYYEQAHVNLAGTQFIMSPGPLWCATGECGPTDGACAAEGEHGDRQTELVCIGQELDHAAIEAALGLCLLTDEEMAEGKDSWAALPDPFREAWDMEIKGVAGVDANQAHFHGHGHGHKHLVQGVNPKLLTVMAPQPSMITTDKIVFSATPAGLAKIKDDDVQLAVWRRASPPKFVTALSDPSITESSLPNFKGVVASTGVTQALRRKLDSQQYCSPSNGELDELVGDVDQLVRVFAKVTKLKSVFVRLEVLADNGCSSWHQDCVPFRLVTTYRGPCTEWVHPDVSNSTLRRKTADSTHAQSLSHHDVALFKGRGKTDHGDALLNHPGIVHRSPRIEGSGVHRVVLVLDMPQPFHLE